MQIDFSGAQFQKMCVHRIGNSYMEDGCYMSSDLQVCTDEEEQAFMMLFLRRVSRDKFYNLDMAESVYNLVSKMFTDTDNFVGYSVKLGSLLYAASKHPSIVSGEMYIVYMQDVIIEDEQVDAIGIYRTEKKERFIETAEYGDVKPKLKSGKGLDNIDKGCLIFNTDKELGYKCCIIDESSKKKNSASYWIEDFLHANPSNDDYSVTKTTLKAAKDWVEYCVQEGNMENVDAIVTMNNISEFFNQHTVFDPKKVEAEIFGGDTEMTQSFFDFVGNETLGEVHPDNSFHISESAVKEERKFFKSVLKLDRNFSVYIHGNRNFIEKCFDPEKNMNYYKLYYASEK